LYIWFEFQKEIIFEFKFEILFLNQFAKTNLAQPASWPNRPASPPSPPGWAKPAGSGLGRSNRPSPAPLPFLAGPRRPSGDWIAAAVAWPFRLTPATIAAATLANDFPQYPLPAPPSGIA
jgi:hypothetical protein